MTLRGDLQLVQDLINPGARVLDLGCGDGALLDNLQRHKGVNGYGLDRDPVNINRCLASGVNVVQQDLDHGIGNFLDDSFDMVVMTNTLQAVKNPRTLLREMLRVGEECLVTFPNFGHWQCRHDQYPTGGEEPQNVVARNAARWRRVPGDISEFRTLAMSAADIPTRQNAGFSSPTS